MEISKMKIVWLFLALVTTCLLAAPSFSMPNGEVAFKGPQDESFSHENMSEMPPSVAMRAIYAGRGFAIGSNDDFHPVWVMVEQLRFLSPSQVRRHLRENRSIEEIKAEIAKYDETLVYQGYMQLGALHYSLVNIDLTQEEAKIRLNADVNSFYMVGVPCNPPCKSAADPFYSGEKTSKEPVSVSDENFSPWGMLKEKARSIQQFLGKNVLGDDKNGGKTKGDEIVGHISLEIAYRDGAWIGDGELIMDLDQYMGRYTLLLDMSRP